jgi:signal transduction histidine kinase
VIARSPVSDACTPDGGGASTTAPEPDFGNNGAMSTALTPPGRLQLTAYAAWQLLLVAPALALFIVEVVGGVLSVIVIGIPLLLVTIPATRWVADQHRAMAGHVLGTPIPPQYRPTRTGGLLTRLVGWASDPMTWRDLVWLLVACTVGFAVALFAVLLLLMVVTGALWWFGIEPIMRARSAMDRWFLSFGHTEKLEQRVQVLTETRSETLDHSAAELRRLERDLHDGAQARLVALSMSLGLADDLFNTDPEGARRMVSDARATTSAALGDLRSVVRGIHPPVLADRGLGGAVESLALDMGLPVEVTVRLEGRPPAPVESAAYFAVAECLANVGKHAAATQAWVTLTHEQGSLRVVVGDDGRGGADPASGTGMLGVMRRLAAFDGTMRVSSPTGGPTLVTLEVPCALSSPKTTPSSGPA